MKKTFKRTLSLFLATLIAFGAGTAAGAAPTSKQTQMAPAEARARAVTQSLQSQDTATLTIDTPPANTGFVLEQRRPNDTGLVVTLTDGDFTMQIRYGDLYADGENFWSHAACGVGAYTYNGATEEYEDVTSPGTYDLVIWAQYEDSDGNYYYAETSCPYTVTSVLADSVDNAAALTLDSSITVMLTEEQSFAVYKITPVVTGTYSFTSSDNGDSDPIGYLYDSSLRIIASDDDSGGNLNFDIVASLAAGETYYILACTWGGNISGTITYKLTAARTKPLNLPAAYRMNYHETLADTLLKDCGWPVHSLYFEFDSDFIQPEWETGALMAVKRGTTTIVVTAPDGSSATVNLTVGYSIEQWLCVIFLAGWYWMPFTSTGPLDLRRELERLQEVSGMSLGDGVQYFLFQLFAPALVAGKALFSSGLHSMHNLYSGDAPEKILILGNSFIGSSEIKNALTNLLAYNDCGLVVDTFGIGYGEVTDFIRYAENGAFTLSEYDAVFVCGFYTSSYNKLPRLIDLADGADTKFIIFPAPNEQPTDFSLAWVKDRRADYLGWYDLVHYLWDKKGFGFEELAWNDMHSHSNEAAGYLAAMAVYTYLYGELPEHAADAELFDVPGAWADLTQEQLFAKMQVMRTAMNDMVLKASVRYYAETVIDWYKSVF